MKMANEYEVPKSATGSGIMAATAMLKSQECCRKLVWKAEKPVAQAARSVSSARGCTPLILIGSKDHVGLVVGICARFNRNRGLTANIHGLMPHICGNEDEVSCLVVNNNLSVGANKSASLTFQDVYHGFRTVMHMPKPFRSGRQNDAVNGELLRSRSSLRNTPIQLNLLLGYGGNSVPNCRHATATGNYDGLSRRDLGGTGIYDMSANSNGRDCKSQAEQEAIAFEHGFLKH
jgi:hypothetical protein